MPYGGSILEYSSLSFRRRGRLVVEQLLIWCDFSVWLWTNRYGAFQNCFLSSIGSVDTLLVGLKVSCVVRHLARREL